MAGTACSNMSLILQYKYVPYLVNNSARWAALCMLQHSALHRDRSTLIQVLTAIESASVENAREINFGDISQCNLDYD